MGGDDGGVSGGGGGGVVGGGGEGGWKNTIAPVVSALPMHVFPDVDTSHKPAWLAFALNDCFTASSMVDAFNDGDSRV